MSAAVAIAHGLRRCKGCGTDFTPRRRDQEHCSSGCRVRALREKRKQQAPLELVATDACNPFAELRGLVRDIVDRLHARGAVNADDALELTLHGDELVLREALEMLRIGRLSWADIPEEVRDVLRLAAKASA